MKSNDRAFFTGVMAAIVIGGVVGFAIIGVNSIQKSKAVTETFYVGTPVGIVFKVEAKHRCSIYLRQAAAEVTSKLDAPLDFPSANKIIVALTYDYTRLYFGEQCKIQKLNFTNITTGEK